MAVRQSRLAPAHKVRHPDVPVVDEGNDVGIVGAHGGIESCTRCFSLDFIGEERAGVARARVGTEEEGAAGGEDDAPGGGLEVVAGDAPAGALLPLPQQLLLLGHRPRDHLKHRTFVTITSHITQEVTWKPASMRGHHWGFCVWPALGGRSTYRRLVSRLLAAPQGYTRRFSGRIQFGGIKEVYVTWFTKEVQPVPSPCSAEGEAGGGAEAAAGHLRVLVGQGPRVTWERTSLTV